MRVNDAGIWFCEEHTAVENEHEELAVLKYKVDIELDKHEDLTLNESLSICPSCSTLLAGPNEPCSCQDFSEAQVSARDWQLPTKLPLAQLAAEFYILMDLYLKKTDEGRFTDFVTQWLPVFTNYTDMVLGGELRHGKGLLEQFSNCESESGPLVELIMHCLDARRGKAWYEWKAFRREHGVSALVWAADCFRCFPRSSMGGKRWATIADQLQYLEAGFTTPVLFMDTCWGLEHNGGCYFNKMPSWNRSGLREVLDANLREDMDYLHRIYEGLWKGVKV
jgi:hypothetical protein